MTDTGRSFYTGGGGGGVVFDVAAGEAQLVAGDSPPGITFPFGDDFTDLGDWPDQENTIALSGTPSFGSWDDFNEGASYEFNLTSGGLMYFEARVIFSGPGTALDRRARIKVDTQVHSPWAFHAYNDCRIAWTCPTAENSGISLQFASADTSDAVIGVNFLIRRILTGTWEF